MDQKLRSAPQTKGSNGKQAGYVKPEVQSHKLQDFVLAGSASGADVLGTPNTQF